MLFEVLATVALWALIWKAGRRIRVRWLSAWSRWFARHPALTVLAIGCLGALISAGLVALRGVPIPWTHDEFGYLLNGETYARGRLTNPPHPFWQHFEAMHILQQPTRISKYPPGQGLVLAAGERLAGQPIVGVWLSLGLVSAAIGWMLLAWLPPRWALLGAACAAVRLAGGGWGEGYWGGAVAATGGALLLGSVRRMAERPDWRCSLLLGLGLVILANSRPFEGLVVTLLAGLVLLVAWWRFRALHSWGDALAAAGPACLVVLAGAVAMGISNRAVTGNPWRMAYQEHDAQYAGCPTFLCQSLGPPPEYRHADMQEYYAGWERSRFERRHAGWGLNASYFTKLRNFLTFFIGPALLGPLLIMTPFPAGFWPRSAWLILVGTLVAATQPLYLFPHYVAPLTGPVWFVVLAGARRLAASRIRGFRQPLLVSALLVVAGIGPLTETLASPLRRSPRDRIARRLQQEPGRDLVLLEFFPGYDVHDSWVYNAVDLDESPIVWARSLGDAADAELRAYFADRRVWRVCVANQTAVLMPDARFPASSTSTSDEVRTPPPESTADRPPSAAGR